MDNLTHTLFGATLGRAVFPRAGRGTAAALLLASNAPDADIVMTAGGALNYLSAHRGATHGPLGIAGLGLVTAALVWGWQRGFDGGRRHEHAPYGTLVAAAVAGLLAHVLMDFPTSYGTRLFSPFDWHWYSADLMPIVDVYLLAVLAAGFVWGRRVPSRARRVAVLVLALAALDYGGRVYAHGAAIHRAPAALGPLLAPPCADAVPSRLVARWPRETPQARRERGASRCLVEIAAVPTFASPFRWLIIARLSDGYHTQPLDLLDRDGAPRAGAPSGDPRASGDGRLDAPWRRAVAYPDQWTPAVLRAADSRLGRVFLDFSRFPAAASVVRPDGTGTVEWTDLRFVEGPARRPGAPRGLFTATVTIGRDGGVITERLGN